MCELADTHLKDAASCTVGQLPVAELEQPPYEVDRAWAALKSADT